MPVGKWTIGRGPLKAKTRRKLGLGEAQRLSAELREHYVRRTATSIRKWSPWLVRTAELWLGLNRFTGTTPSFEAYVEQRRDLRHCRICGCSDDDPCDDGCTWAEGNLCSACVREEGTDDAHVSNNLG